MNHIIQQKVLPISNPVLSCWTWQANLFAVLATIPDSNKWIFNNYIQLYCEADNRNSERLFLDFLPGDDAIFACPFFFTQMLRRKTILSLYENVEDFFINVLNADNYIYGIFDENKFLCPDQANQNNKYLHELFIYGYNREMKTFYIADFTLGDVSKYSFGQSGMAGIANAFINVTEPEDYLFEGNTGLVLFSRKEEIKKVQLDTRIIAKRLTEYVESINTFRHYRLENVQNSSRVFGLNIYDLLIEKISADNLDVRALHNLYAHKVLMVERIKYMLSNGYLKDNHLDEYTSIMNKCNTARNLCIKNMINAKDNSSAAKRILPLLGEVKEQERELYTKTIHSIRHENMSHVSGGYQSILNSVC